MVLLLDCLQLQLHLLSLGFHGEEPPLSERGLDVGRHGALSRSTGQWLRRGLMLPGVGLWLLCVGRWMSCAGLPLC